MYIHKSQLRHLLTPKHYSSQEHYQLEIERLFLPTWHCVGTIGDLRRDGDFVTFDLLDRPVQVRNMGGAIHAFLNVCAHRHCLLTHERKGRDPRFRCQYHGWEYTSEGRTGRIPDAQCFRPFDRDNARLQKLRAETCGELVFVSFAQEGPSLREYLGDFHQVCADSFRPPFRPRWRMEREYPCNWKVPIENTVESYHIPCLHPKTFKQYASEEDTDHDLNERYSTYRTPEPVSLARTWTRWFTRRLGQTPQSVYVHHLIHPHLVVITMDVLRMVHMFLPTSPTTVRQHVILYTLNGRTSGPWARLLSWAIGWMTKVITDKVISEDRRIFTDVQLGMRASPHPGVIGTLEERVYAFQEFVARECGVGTGVSRNGEKLDQQATTDPTNPPTGSARPA